MRRGKSKRPTSKRPTMLGGALMLGLGLGLSLSCVDIGVFPCERDSQCELGAQQGRCFDPGYCALPDATCESGYRFHAGSVPEDLGGRCVEISVESTTSTGSASSTGSMDSETSEGSGSTGSTGSSSEDGSSTTTGDNLCGDRPCGCASAIGTGLTSTCAVRFDGRVACWGSNDWAQLGDGQLTEPTPVPQEVLTPEGMVVASITSGSFHVCARADDDAAVCWGRNSADEIDPDLSQSSLEPVTPSFEGMTGSIGMGVQHTCVGSTAGPELRCLGGNGFDKLGAPEGDPVDTAIPGAMPVEGMGLGRDHSCAMAGGRVWCWGRNNYGQVGDPMVSGTTPDPTEVMLTGDAVMIAGGRDHTCVVLDEPTNVMCWGRNVYGQVGDGTQVNRMVPTAIKDPLPSPVVQIVGRYDTTCTLLEDHSVWCWGATQGDHLGIAIQPSTEMREPMRVETIETLDEDLVEIGLGQFHLCGRAESGRMWCWGRNNFEQIGPDVKDPEYAQAEVDLGCPPGVGN